jgi:hypothetical protein
MRLLSCLRVLLVLVTMGSLVGCATSGQKFDTTHVNDIQKGVHTKTQITEWFGPQQQTSAIQNSPAGCVERWIYVFAKARVGAATQSESLVVDFDSSGKVCDHAYTKI